MTMDSHSNPVMIFFMKAIYSILILTAISCSNLSNTSERRFSNTMTWDKDYWNMTTHPLTVISDKDVFVLPPPPGNTSEETKKELQHLLALQAARTPETEAEIKTQVNFKEITFDCFQIKNLMDTKYQYLPKIFEMVTLDLVGTITRQKRIYDRVRAIYLEKGLTTVVPNPGHPAYPSGHSTEMHFYAHVFSEMNPTHKDIYFKNAKRVAENRELAGVHYPSDTKAGVLLSEQFFKAVMKNEKFNKLVKNAAVEFNRDFKCQ